MPQKEQSDATNSIITGNSFADNIEGKIITIRGIQVIIDKDLATLYGVETKVLNQAVKRNLNRFPESSRFRLSSEETKELVTNCDRFGNLKHSTASPYAFTEQGIAQQIIRTNPE